MSATVYDSKFFALVADTSLRNARVVVPLVMELVSPKSVLDVGCGPCAWLKAFEENGVEIICGIDGEYADRAQLLVDDKNFLAADLTQPFRLDRKYDLALCIEVAEHLPEDSARGLIERLTASAPVVLFSAAIPGQGGTSHINEQWPSHWRECFAEREYVMLDLFRPRIRDDPRISWYIRQNLVLFACRQWLDSQEKLHVVDDIVYRDGGWVHANVYANWFERANRELGVKDLVRQLPGAIRRSIARRLKRLGGSYNWYV